MKFISLDKFEEKIVFRTSHIFFLSLVGVVLLAMVISVFLFLWGLTPSLKPTVEKAAYPPPVTVSLDEIKHALKPAKQINTQTQNATESSYLTVAGNDDNPQQTDSSRVKYDQRIARMKELLPPKKFLWKNKGHYDYWRRWKIDTYGIQSQLDFRFNSVHAGSFVDKKRLLDSYITILEKFDMGNRYKVLQSLLAYTRGTTDQAVQNMKVLARAVPYFNKEDGAFLSKLSRFGRKNPRDGQAFIAHVATVISRFDPSQREKALDNMIAAYYNLYNDINRQKEATQRFMPLLSKLETGEQARALTLFYNTFENKNRAWRDTIARIDRAYQNELFDAEKALAMKKQAKSEYRKNALIGLGGGIVFIAIVALILSLLSIQRNIAELKSMTIKPADIVAKSPKDSAIKVQKTI